MRVLKASVCITLRVSNMPACIRTGTELGALVGKFWGALVVKHGASRRHLGAVPWPDSHFRGPRDH